MRKFSFLAYCALIFLSSRVYADDVKSPTNLAASAGNGMVTLSWDAVKSASSYNLYLSRYSGVSNQNYLTHAGMKIEKVTSPYELTGLNNDVSYYFVVTAIDNSSESPPSSEASATPESVSNSTISFEDVSIKAGLSQTKRKAFGNPSLGDINNDGNIDIVDTHHQHSISIYLNNGDETFNDFTEDSGVANETSRYDRHGIAIGDYDNDGNLDFFIGLGSASGTGKDYSQLWKGDGTGYFTDVASDSGIQLLGIRDSKWFDYNNDGYLDLSLSFEYVSKSDDEGVLFKNDKNGFFEDVTDSTGLADAFDIVTSFADYDNDGDMDFFSCGVKDKLYTNNGDDTFTKNSGIPAKTPGRGIAWGDYNNDGFIDLYIARGQNDYHKTVYWDESRIDFSFTEYPEPPETGEVTFKYGSSTTSSITFNLVMNGTSSTTQYIYIGNKKENPSKKPFTLSADTVTGQPEINAGKEDGFFVWRDEVEDEWHIQWTEPSGTLGFWGHIISDGEFTQVENNTNLNMSTNYINTLYLNNGDGTFTDVTEDSGTGHIGNNTGVTWGDFDNDGLLDLYIVDAGDVLGNRFNTLYHNIGNGKFEDITSVSGVSAVDATGRHYGVASGDFNNDGAIDLWLSNGYGWGYPLSNGKSILLKNSGNENNWLKLKLVGTKSNKSGIGSRIVLKTGSGIQSRQLNGTGGEFYSQGLAPVHFGLGQVSEIDSITIYWPSGIVQKLYNISANQELTIVESDEGSPTPTLTPTPSPSPTIPATPQPSPSITPLPSLSPTPTPQTTGRISGSVVDTSGIAVKSVNLRLKGQKTNVSSTTVTGTDGSFGFMDLKADTYIITARKKGYKKVKLILMLEEGEEIAGVQIVLKKLKGKKHLKH